MASISAGSEVARATACPVMRMRLTRTLGAKRYSTIAADALQAALIDATRCDIGIAHAGKVDDHEVGPGLLQGKGRARHGWQRAGAQRGDGADRVARVHQLLHQGQSPNVSHRRGLICSLHERENSDLVTILSEYLRK